MINSAISDKELNELINDWWWLIFFVPGILAGFSEHVRDFFQGLIQNREEREELRHRRALELARAQSETAIADPKPGECVHRSVKPVVDEIEDKVVAWLCTSCDTQLPATWAVRKKDL